MSAPLPRTSEEDHVAHEPLDSPPDLSERPVEEGPIHLPIGQDHKAQPVLREGGKVEKGVLVGEGEVIYSPGPQVIPHPERHIHHHRREGAGLRHTAPHQETPGERETLTIRQEDTKKPGDSLKHSLESLVQRLIPEQLLSPHDPSASVPTGPPVSSTLPPGSRI